MGEGSGVLKSRALRLLIGALLAVALLGALAWLAVPPLLKWQLETRGSQLLARQLRVGDVHFAPTTLALTLRDLSIGAAPDDADTTPQLQIGRLFIDINARSLLRLAPVLDALEVDAPRLRLARVGERRFDIDDLLQRLAPDPQQPPAEPARFALFNLRLVDGELRFDDRPMGRNHVLRQLQLDLPFLSNLADDIEVKVEPRLAFDFNGSAFDSRGESTPFAQGRASDFTIRFAALDLTPMWAYLPAALSVKPVSGRLGADLRLHFEQSPGGAPQVELNGRVELQDFGLEPPGGAPLLAWKALQVQLAGLRPLQRQLSIDAVQFDGLLLHVRRDAGGGLELQRLAQATPSAAAAASAPAAASATPGWQLKLGLLELKDAQVRWSDATLQPAAEMQLDRLQLQLKGLQWPLEADAGLRLQAQLLAQGQPRGQLQAEGTLTDRQAKIALQLADIDLALAEPYLRQVLRPQASAKLNSSATLDWARGDAPRLQLGVPKLRIDDFRLAESRASGAHKQPALAQLASLELSDLQADLLQRRVAIGALSLQQPFIDLSRDAAGALNARQWWIAPPAPAADAAPEAAAAPTWQLTLRDFKLDGGRARLADAALRDGPLELSALRVAAQTLAWPAVAPLDTQLSASLTLPGKADGGASASASKLNWRGRISPQPLGASGQLRLERFPVHVFEPYFGAELPVLLQRLEAGFQGRLELKQSPGGLAGQVRGEALLADLRVLARPAAGAAPDAAERELITWNAVSIGDFGLSLQPDSKPMLEIGELRITDYYSRLEITEEGRFNLQTVAAPAGAAKAAAPAPAASAVQVSAPSAMLSRLPIDLVVNSTRFDNGRVDFRDRFIRPNYSAQLSDLNGTVGRLDSRTRDMATLQFSGRVAGTGLLEIGGAVNPTVIPPALDIKAKAHDIELPGLTPYSSKYAGYPIERGKLSVDVAYKIESDGKLEASNQIIVNQLTFGPKTDSPDATKLPVPFIVALLQDRHGVIDLDLPLTGSVNDPQFSMGALIWKVILNLFTKVVSSPFAAIGGGGKDLSHVDFKPGTALIADGSQEIIAKVAKALDDRPQLKLGIVAMADPVSEAEAMRRAAFESRLLAEQRRERGRGALGSNDADAPLPPLSAEQRARLIKQIYEDTRLPDKPRNFIGMAKDIPIAEMEAMLVAAMPVDEAVGRLLAQQRGRTVRDALMAKGLGSARLFLGEPKLRDAAADNRAWVPRAELSLSVN
jgi:uncharacterized protein involved in outer membrane biogenesis